MHNDRSDVRILFVSDTHLGFDLPARPRVQRRRRGVDFFDNFDRALEPARRGEADLVVHGGDLLYRSKVPPELVARALEPLKEIASSGVCVYLVPGNHERSKIPYPLLAQQENLFVFDRPRVFRWERGGMTLALAGFPYARRARGDFGDLVEATGWRAVNAQATLLVIHQAVEGARVDGYTFRDGDDVVRLADVPDGVTAVLSGHIHRAQALTHDLRGRRLAAPVLYPGSIERTSFAEKRDRKGYLTLSIDASGGLRGWRFHELESRPMMQIELGRHELEAADLESRLAARLAELPPDAVVQLRVHGEIPDWMSAAAIRELAPASMNIALTVPRRSRQAGPT